VNGIEFMVKAFCGDVRTGTTFLQTGERCDFVCHCYRNPLRRAPLAFKAAAQAREFSMNEESRHSMEWVRPDFEEILSACEINSYAEAT